MAYIVLVEDEQLLRRTLTRSLERLGHDVRATESAEEAIETIRESPPDLLITDNRLPGQSGTELLHQIRKEAAEVVVILMTAYGSIEDAVEAMRAGASDYLRKPIDLHELGIVVERCLSGAGIKKELDYYRSRDLAERGAGGIIGNSKAIREVKETVSRLAGLEKKGGGGPTILISGETGTGKGLIARAIHKASARHDFPFIEVNCTAIPDSLLEAEVLGYERGAFTGATTAKAGLVEAAEGGTIFFDEIGRMELNLQAKALKIIEEKIVRRLGSTRDRKVNCTVITASHLDLADKVTDGTFLQDLYHRINVVSLELPPLRERGGDLPLLTEFFLKMHAAEYGMHQPKLTDAARDALSKCAWPGNVRQLSHALERALVMSAGDSIDVDDLALSDQRSPQQRTAALSADGIQVDFSRGPVRLEEIEVALIQSALEETGGNQVKAARLVGMSRDTLRYRMEKFKLR